MRVLAVCGSLRADSLNARLLRACGEMFPPQVRVEYYDGLRDIPPYDADHDGVAPPDAVTRLRREIADADALFIATPEYNWSVPGVLKNALDWASRPADASSLRGKPVGIVGASTGPLGTVRGQIALRQVLACTDSRTLTKPELLVFDAHERFTGGCLTNPRTEALAAAYVEAFLAHVRAGTQVTP